MRIVLLVVYMVVGVGFVMRDFTQISPPLYVRERNYAWVPFVVLLWPLKIVPVMLWITRLLG